MTKDIKVLVVEPEKLPYETTIRNTLREKQNIVGGNIQVAYLENDDDVVLICNEEGKINGMPLNRDIGYDIIAGNFIISGDNYHTGEFVSLTEDQIKKYKQVFNEKSIEETKAKIEAIKMTNYYYER